jgi:hypothetical protein
LANFVVIKNQNAVIGVNSLSSCPEYNEFGLCRVDGHFVGPKPVRDFLQLTVHVQG